jgi:uncharacterized membrane-anchored protein YhcB (DUF1043 family)
MKNLIFILISYLLFVSEIQGINEVKSTVVKSDSIQYVVNYIKLDSLQLVIEQYDLTIDDLKAENKKLKSQDILIKIFILLIGGIVGFIFSRLNSHFDKRNRIKKDFKSYYETLVEYKEKFDRVCKLLPASYKNNNPEYINKLPDYFNEIKSHFNEVSNFSYGEYSSEKMVEIRNYFTDSTLIELISAFTKAVTVYNVLYNKSLNESTTIELILKTMKIKADNIV